MSSVAGSAKFSHAPGSSSYAARRRSMQRAELHLPKHAAANPSIKYNKLLLEKNFTSAELSLSKPLAAVSFANAAPSTTGSENDPLRSRNRESVLPLLRRGVYRQKTAIPIIERNTNLASFRKVKTAKADVTEVINEPNSDETDNGFKHLPTLVSKSEPQNIGGLPSPLHEEDALLKLTLNKRGELGVQRHITTDFLCKHLKAQGYGDPRDSMPLPVPMNPNYFLRRRMRQRNKYPYYDEKLKGCARMDMESANGKAAAFIEQQKDAQAAASPTKRHASAIWRKRFRRVIGGNNVERFTEKGDQISMFEFWDEDRPSYAMDEMVEVRINAWLEQVNKALNEQ